MREIKFRIWDKERKEWVKDKFYIGNDSILFDCEGKELVECDDPERFVICQYTGVKDRNSIEIYEDDIFKFEFKEQTMDKNIGTYHGVVMFDNGCFYIEFNTRKVELGSLNRHDNSIQWREYPVNYYEIINMQLVGNKLENPELLK